MCIGYPICWACFKDYLACEEVIIPCSPFRSHLHLLGKICLLVDLHVFIMPCWSRSLGHRCTKIYKTSFYFCGDDESSNSWLSIRLYLTNYKYPVKVLCACISESNRNKLVIKLGSHSIVMLTFVYQAMMQQAPATYSRKYSKGTVYWFLCNH